MAELSPSTNKLIQKYQSWYKEKNKEKTGTIHVDEVALAVAAFYEKIRGVVDWREEHLMKRAAIERILKRRLLIKNGDDVAEPLVLELIRGGHFPNNQVPETKINEVRKVISKYLFILENSPQPPKKKQKVHLYDWLLGIAACEIEDVLSPASREKALIEFMTESMATKIEVQQGIDEKEKRVQTYIAVQKALLKLDASIIGYNLLTARYPQWKDLDINNSLLNEMTQSIYEIWKRIEKDFKHPLKDRFYKVCEQYDTPYLLLGDILTEDPMSVGKQINDPITLERKAIEAYNKRLATLKARTKRAAIYATLSIFLTKMLLAFLIEIPFDVYLASEFNKLTLLLNILIPSSLMCLLVLTIRPPKSANLQRAVMEVIKISYLTEKKDSYQIKIRRKRSWLMNAIITFFYLLTFIVSFGLIIGGLIEISFSFLSIIIFLIFTSLIAFAGIKLRERSKELDMIKEKDSFLMIIVDLFSMPVIRLGRWLSSQWVRYNIIVIVINFLIDMPFQRFVEFLEQWRAFLKEKREEIH